MAEGGKCLSTVRQGCADQADPRQLAEDGAYLLRLVGRKSPQIEHDPAYRELMALLDTVWWSLLLDEQLGVKGGQG